MLREFLRIFKLWHFFFSRLTYSIKIHEKTKHRENCDRCPSTTVLCILSAPLSLLDVLSYSGQNLLGQKFNWESLKSIHLYKTALCVDNRHWYWARDVFFCNWLIGYECYCQTFTKRFVKFPIRFWFLGANKSITRFIFIKENASNVSKSTKITQGTSMGRIWVHIVRVPCI